jgi:hypothetical protein
MSDLQERFKKDIMQETRLKRKTLIAKATKTFAPRVEPGHASSKGKSSYGAKRRKTVFV